MNYLTRAFQYLLQHRKATALIVVLCVIFGLGTNIFLNYALIELSVVTPSSVRQADIQAYANQEIKTSTISGGISLIPRSTASLTIATKNQQMRTIAALDIPWYGIVSKHVTLDVDKNADKIAFRSSLYNNCSSYDATSDRLLAYACYGNSGLTYYNTSSADWLNSLVTKVDINGPVSAYRGGVMGLSSVNDRDASSRSAPIEYISPNGTRHHYAFPDNFIEYNDFSQISVVTDSTDPSNSHFMLINEGVVYLASVDVKDNVSYTMIPAPSNYNSASNQTLCTFKSVDAYCYRGILATDDTDSKSISIQPTITKMSFNNSNTQSFTSDVRIADSLYVTTGGQLFIKNYKSLSYLKKVANAYTTQLISNNVDDAQADANIHFIDNTGVFTYNATTTTATQVFRSANISPKHLMTSGGRVFILGHAADDTSFTYTYAWVLNSETDTSYGTRLIDMLPQFSASGVNDDVDLVGKNINITVRYDNNEAAASIHQQKQTTLDYLKLKGVNTSEVTLTNP